MPEVDLGGKRRSGRLEAGPGVSHMEWRVLWTRGEVSVKASNPGDGRKPVALGGCSAC